MVFEALINPKRPVKHPTEMIALGAFYASLALLLAVWIFESNAGLVMVFFVVMAYAPFFYYTIKLEEKKDMTGMGEEPLLKEHGRVVSLFIYFFIGVTLATAFWYVVLPESGSIFSIQQKTIADINTAVTTGAVAAEKLLPVIFFNNLRVLVLCVLFSLFYGFGALFILSWNASVIGVAVGNFMKNHIAQYAGLLGLEKVSVYFTAASLGFLRYAIHGIPEVLAYFIGGLAGGILSVSIIRRDFRKENFQKVVIDVVDLLLIAVFILLVAALLEVYLTPLLF
ncbi:MAG TPA: stage II sporulation protein M [Candidatus Nanoarchaeia archaeon]|nr:stage II sporulation protein M [Candidatus Nanoarchaeia archaeon]